MRVKKVRSDWHRLTNINGKAYTAVCSICGTIKICKRNNRGKNVVNYRCTNSYGRNKKYGKHKNNSLDNLITVCANCHRLETHHNRIRANRN